jgi:hypothetical protein
MKLILRRNQIEQKGLFFGSKIIYSLSIYVELTNEEAELAEKYKINNEILSSIKLTDGTIYDVTIGTLSRGVKFDSEDIACLLQYEQDIKNACAIFKIHINTRKNYCGDETIEY